MAFSGLAATSHSPPPLAKLQPTHLWTTHWSPARQLYEAQNDGYSWLTSIDLNFVEKAKFIAPESMAVLTKFSGFSLSSAGKTTVFSQTCEEIFPNSIQEEKDVHLSLEAAQITKLAVSDAVVQE